MPSFLISELVLKYCYWWAASTVNTSVFNALSIGSGLVAAVGLYVYVYQMGKILSEAIEKAHISIINCLLAIVCSPHIDDKLSLFNNASASVEDWLLLAAARSRIHSAVEWIELIYMGAPSS